MELVIKGLAFIQVFLLFMPMIQAQNRQIVCKSSTDTGYAYLLYTPEMYERSRDEFFPLVIFLHGSGERGDDPQKVKKHGPPKMIGEGTFFPFILVSPQCPFYERWCIGKLRDLLDEILEKYRVDPSRIYLTGLSMGGYGTWDMAIEYPGIFAAIVPICGCGDPERAKRIRHIPIWVFHGSEDKAVDERCSAEMVDALEKCNGKVKYTRYEGAGHAEAWENAYGDPELWEWMLNQKKRQDCFPE